MMKRCWPYWYVVNHSALVPSVRPGACMYEIFSKSLRDRTAPCLAFAIVKYTGRRICALLYMQRDVEDTAVAREQQHAAMSATFTAKTPNPTAYTRDTGFVHDVLCRKPNVAVRSEPRRNWDVPVNAKAHVFGADALFHENTIASASDGVIRVRGLSSNDQLFNFDEIPMPQNVLSVKALRRMDRRTEDQHAKILGLQAQTDDAESVHSDADSVREATNFLLPSGHGRWLTGPVGKHVVRERAAAGKLPAASMARIDLSMPTDAAARYDDVLRSPREDINAPRGSRKHACACVVAFCVGLLLLSLRACDVGV